VSQVARFEKAWAAACEHAQLGKTHTSRAKWGGTETKSLALPTITGPAKKVARAGFEWACKPAGGGTIEQINMAGEVLEAELGVHSIVVHRGERASDGVLVAHFAPPFPDVIPWRVPEEWSLDATLGLRADGKPFGVTIGHAPHLLGGGTTGSGKSVLARSLIASAACLEGVELWGCDPKVAELAQWAPRFSDIATDIPSIQDLLERACAAKDERMRLIAAAGATDLGGVCRARGVEWVPEAPWVVLVIDELAMPMADRQGCRPRLFELAQQARAAGIQLVSLTQSPGVDVVPTPFRINHAARWVGLCNGPNEVEIMIGSKDLAKRAPAWMLPPDSGEAFWRSGAGNQVHHVRGSFLDPSDIGRVCAASLSEKPAPSLPGCTPIVSGPDVAGAERHARTQAQGPGPAAVDPGLVEQVAARIVEIFEARAESGGLAAGQASAAAEAPRPADNDTPTPIRKGRRKAPAGFPAPDAAGRAAGHRIAAWELHGDMPACAGCGQILDWAGDVRVDPADLTTRCKPCMGQHRGAA